MVFKGASFRSRLAGGFWSPLLSHLAGLQPSVVSEHYWLDTSGEKMANLTANYPCSFAAGRPFQSLESGKKPTSEGGVGLKIGESKESTPCFLASSRSHLSGILHGD
ncbi:hypothetical protein GYMLUDRAFT_394015 [Collybiopsis luxurians FD-317 M1]|uniref:Uncharacterized protein n=1 Tax=Collybiopsis luxurians FD-317 M1 TaxID=944289 RepID=A0A0D0C1A4_9AGAR|nr:hypothetical protein GYMLUDRAFT_394015 [Collybiopsis luxurians FD-317 M1]